MKKMINSLKASMFAFSMVGLLVVGAPAKAATKNQAQKENVNVVVSENWITPHPVYDGDEVEEGGLALYGALPAKYDPRNVNGKCMVPAVRNQANHNTCWAFAAIGAMECNLIKKGYADSSIDLSENQFAYFFYHRQPDRLKNTEGDYNLTRKAWDQAGGTLYGSGIAMSTWAGATMESVSPYFTGSVDNSLAYRHDYSVQNVIYYPYDVKRLSQSVERIKNGISQYGAVATGMYMEHENANYYNPVTGGYYFNGAKTEQMGHAVVIVGWDDNYSRDNFGHRKPSRNGAWIIKNSYGTNFGDNGFNYISYEDIELKEMMSLDVVPASAQYDNNYQYDGTANPMYSIGGNGITKITAANVFKAKAAGGKIEELKAVSVESITTNTSYELQVYSGLKSASKPTSGTKVFSSPVKGTFASAGYQMIKLPRPIALMPGETFSVVITLKNSSIGPHIGIDTTGGEKGIAFQAKVGKNQSFLYSNGRWYDTSAYASNGISAAYNFRLKAFTDSTDIKPTISISDTGVSKGSSTTMSLTSKAGKIYRDATWSSSNTDVATISAKGKLKAKSYGTTTITVTYKNGSKKKTIKSKVTVGPKKIKGFAVTGNAGLVSTKWKKVVDADGYQVCYSESEYGTYTTLANLKKGQTSASKKLNSGVYYVKMRAYKKNGKKKLWGGYTAAKKVVVQ